MNFRSPLSGLWVLLDDFPQLALWAIIERHPVAEFANG
jgi:hypothetical protein